MKVSLSLNSKNKLRFSGVSDSESIGQDSKPDTDKTKNGQIVKRPRTILNQVQRKLFKNAFEATPKPCRKVL